MGKITFLSIELFRMLAMETVKLADMKNFGGTKCLVAGHMQQRLTGPQVLTMIFSDLTKGWLL